MRRVTCAVALLTLIGCASHSQPRVLAVEVFEGRPQAHALNRATAEGAHIFRIRVTNQSEEAVWIDMISLESFSNEIRFYNADQTVSEILEPGQTSDFPMSVDVQLVPMSHVYTIDSLDVAITCHTSTRKSFTEKSEHSVKAE